MSVTGKTDFQLKELHPEGEYIPNKCW